MPNALIRAAVAVANCAASVLAALSFAVAAAAQPKDAPLTRPAWVLATLPARPGAILDNTGYVRCFYEFGVMRIDAQSLRAEGRALFGNDARRLEGAFRRHVRTRKADWSADDWMDDVRVYFFRGQLGEDLKAMEMLPEVPPPLGWQCGGFDDAAWQRRKLGVRKPFRAYQENFRDSSDAIVRNSFYRAYFDLPDPKAAGEVSFSCTYRGGVRVFINGKELTRRDLPEGELPAAARARPYPREAYLLQDDEAPPGRAGCCGDLRCPFEQAPAYRDSKEYRTSVSNQPVSKTGWDRLRLTV